MAPLSYRLLRLGLALLFCTLGGRGRASALFSCDGGNTVLEDALVNDDYCDCQDGADETLTPACSHTGHSRFVCASTGALNQTVPASRVWDGICDCCDGSDELGGWGMWEGMATPCDRNGCQRLLEDAQAQAIEGYRRVKTGLENRPGAEAEGRRAVARWEASLRATEVDEEARKAERKAVEKLEVLLKVYLQDEERLERKERAQLAAARSGCARRDGGRPRAAALGPCEDNTAEREAAEHVRTARAAARARLEDEEIEKMEREKGSRKGGRKNQNKKRPAAAAAAAATAATAEEILDLRWPVASALADKDDSGRGSEEEAKEGGEGDGGGRGKGPAGSGALRLRAYVKQRQQGGGAAARDAGEEQEQTEEKRAEELRKTALLGPVLNAGERGVYLGLTILLRMVGLPLSPLRGLVAVCGFARDQVAKAAANAAGKYGLPSPMRAALEGYRDRGLAGISSHLDYRRYPTLRAVTLGWDEFMEGNGKFLVVMWDAPVALWAFFFPERDIDHQRPEAAMLREGIARAKASLQDSKEAGGGGRQKAQRRKEENEARRLSELDLGDGAAFGRLAERCLELREGGYVYSLCPFKDAKQDKHSLGKWKGWGTSQRGRDRHKPMLFDGGSRCHNKKQRSAEVLVECGPDDALVAAEELEIGQYLLTMETPLACTERGLLESEKQLEVFGLSASDAQRDEEAVDGLPAIPGIDRQEL